MSQARIGREQQTSRGPSGAIFAIVLAIVIVAAAAYLLLSGAYGSKGPSAPYQSAAPATGAPATGAPATGAPHYP